MKRAYSFVVLAIAVLVAAGVAGTASADGLPVLGVDVGGTGVASAAGDARYVTLPAARRGTVVARVSPVGGRVLGSRPLTGSFTIPAVAYDGSASGLSADGRILVLIEPRQSFPRAQTTFTVLAAPQLRPLRVVRLHGDFSFDAISRLGALMYLIQYTVPTDPSHYLVRAYNLHTGRLLAKPITDPREQTDKMRGSPITRATSPDGRFAYTLYDGAGSTPFIHALDTSNRTAHCIDLDALVGNAHLWQLRLTLTNHGDTLTVHNGNDVAAIIDTHTYQVSTPVPPSVTTNTVSRHVLPARLVALTTIAGLVALTAPAAAATVARRRRQPATTSLGRVVVVTLADDTGPPQGA